MVDGQSQRFAPETLIQSTINSQPSANLTAILVAAGRSRRMGFDKLLSPLAGKPVIAHSLAAFEACGDVARIILVSAAERTGEFEKMVAAEGCRKVSAVVPGGAERHLSVWAGLRTLDAAEDGFVAIHDGARPLITPAVISDCLRLAEARGAACCAAPVSDTVKRATPDGLVCGSVDREGLWAMQTPQIFRVPLILEAYARIIERGETVTDEVSAVEKLGKEVALLRNEEWNIKVTFPRDLELASGILGVRRDGR